MGKLSPPVTWSKKKERERDGGKILWMTVAMAIFLAADEEEGMDSGDFEASSLVLSAEDDDISREGGLVE